MDSARTPLGSAPANQWWVNGEEADLTRRAHTPRPLTFDARPQRLTVDAHRLAAIVIDMQNDFCAPGGWLDHIGIDITPARQPILPLQRLLPRLRQSSVPILWVNWGNRPDRLNLSPSLHHVYNPTGSGVGLGELLPGSGAAVLEEGSWSAAIVDELTPQPGDISILKYRMSGFWDTPLDSILRNLDVRTLFFAGVNADQCVLATLMDANFLGYDCVLVQDCTATTSPAFCMEATIYNVQQCFGFVGDSTAITNGLDQVTLEGPPK